MIGEPDLDSAPVRRPSGGVGSDGGRAGERRQAGRQITIPGGLPFRLKVCAAEPEAGGHGGGRGRGEGGQFLRGQHFAPATLKAVHVGPGGQRDIQAKFAEVILHGVL